MLALAPRVTPVALDDFPRGTAVSVPLPAGWCRVWTGFVLPGDRYLDVVKAREGVRAWVPLTLADLIEGGDVYDSAAWFCCLIREGRKDVGAPCVTCGVRPVDFGCRECDACVYAEG